MLSVGKHQLIFAPIRSRPPTTRRDKMSYPAVADEIHAPPANAQEIRRVVFASSVGTVIEWYDFLIYGTAAALVFNKAFFPTFDPLAGTLAALGSYAVG